MARTFLDRLLPLLLAALLASAAHAAPDPAPAPGTTPATPAAAATPTAKLEFAQRTIFVFRAPLAGYSPQDRAEAAEKRIERALVRKGPQLPRTHAIDEGTQVLLDGALLFLVTPADINALAGDTTESVAAESAAELGKALAERREQANPRYLALAAGLCLLATVAYALALRGLGALRRRARRHAEGLLKRRLERISIRNVRLLDAEHYVRFMRHVVSIAVWARGLFATYLWLAFVLGQVPYSRSWGERLQQFLVETATRLAGNVIEAIPGLLVVALIVALARLATLTLASVLKRVESGELQLGWLDRDTAMPTRRLANVVIWLFALAMAYPYLPGSHTAAFQGVTVLAGLMVSIGASSLVGQGAAGLILMYTRSLRKGEYVKIGESEGTVIELGMFETRVRTGLGDEVSMPNGWVLSNTIRNYSRAVPGTGFVLDTVVSIGYDTPWRQVHAMLDRAATATEGLAATPKPFVTQVALSDFYIEYKLVAYATARTPHSRMEVLNRLHQNIVDEFNLYGVQMTSPHFTQEPAHAHVVPRAGWHTAPAVAPDDGVPSRP